MYKGLSIRVVVCALLCACLPAYAQAPEPRKLITEVDTLSQLGYQNSIELQGSESTMTLGFGSRLDEIVESGSLRLRMVVSPALVAVLSHVKVHLNNELLDVLPISEGDAGNEKEFDVALNPRFFSDYNQIRLELIGHLDRDCWNPEDPSIWVEISQASELELQKRKLRLSNDLSLLPAPFFDKRDFSPLELPVVLGRQYQLGIAQAAAMASAYFGSLAEWRGSNFPVLINELPRQHSLVLLTNDNRPDFLKDFPEVTGPSLQMITHPHDPYVKLLLVQGRNAEDLQTAVRGLALGSSLMSGAVAQINKAIQLRPRKPYDAPNWIRTDRPVKLGELVDDLQQLQVTGRVPPAIQVPVALPPDLFTWQSRGIPMDLRYRYSPPTKDGTDSKMSFSINDQFVEAFGLTKKGVNGEKKRVRVPLLDSGFIESGDRVRIPAFRVGNKNGISFQFSFSSVSEGACRTIPAGNYQAVVEADSTLDFTGFPHYLEMPDLHAFATSGFPFTRMADLSNTVVVLPESPSVAEIETLLYLTGYMGASAGYPGLALTLTDRWDKKQLADRDILLLAVNESLGANVASGEKLSLVIDAADRILQRPMRAEGKAFQGWRNAGDQKVAEEISVTADGGFAAIVGRESPYGGNHSLVAIFAAHDTDLKLVQRAISDGGKHPHMFGSVITFRGDKVASFNVGSTYHVGELPLRKLIWYHFSDHPFVLAFGSFLLIILLTVFLWRLLSLIAARRLRVGEGDK